jgi:hypothetical protein
MKKLFTSISVVMIALYIGGCVSLEEPVIPTDAPTLLSPPVRQVGR